MSGLGDERRLGEDARVELAMSASSQARARRPMGLVVLASVAAAIALLAAGWGLVSKSRERERWERLVSTQARVEGMIAEYRQLEERQRAAGETVAGTRVPDLLARMETIATVRAGMREKPPLPRESSSSSPRAQNIIIREYVYEAVRDPSLAALLEWINLAQAEIPGLEVDSVRLTPDQQQWQMRVVFRRWERRS